MFLLFENSASEMLPGTSKEYRLLLGKLIFLKKKSKKREVVNRKINVCLILENSANEMLPVTSKEYRLLLGKIVL